MQITIDIKDLEKVTKSLVNWSKTVSSNDLDKATTKMTESYKTLIRGGMTGEGDLMPLVEESTMNMPIRFGDKNSPIRSSVNGSRKPLVATGEAVNSIKKKAIKDGYEIAPSTDHGELIFGYNALKAPTKRDPLVVGEIQLAMIEDALLKSLDKALFV